MSSAHHHVLWLADWLAGRIAEHARYLMIPKIAAAAAEAAPTYEAGGWLQQQVPSTENRKFINSLPPPMLLLLLLLSCGYPVVYLPAMAVFWIPRSFSVCEAFAT